MPEWEWNIHSSWGSINNTVLRWLNVARIDRQGKKIRQISTTSQFDDKRRPALVVLTNMSKTTSEFKGKWKMFLRAESIQLDGVPVQFLTSPIGTTHWVGLTTPLQFTAKIRADESKTQNSHGNVTALNYIDIQIGRRRDLQDSFKRLPLQIFLFF